MQKLRSIQVLRGLAAFAVVVLHAYPEAHAPVGNAGYGAAGVDLFFVISGFIMASVSKGRTAGQFLSDRLWRIYPLWWVAVLPWLFMVPRGPTSALSSLTLWPIYAGGYFVPVLKVGWTLSFELMFYLAMTLSLATRPAVSLALYALCLAGALTTSNTLLHFIGSPMALEFLMGVLIARLPRRPGLGALIPVGLALLACTSPGIGDVESSFLPQWALWRAILWGLPAAAIVWGALSLDRWFRHRLFNVPVAIGDASYSIYLFHPLVAYGLGLVRPARIALAAGIGWAMHILVERRILAGRSRWPAVLKRLNVSTHRVREA
jgi:exopolysaccharide production protein ExoZ